MTYHLSLIMGEVYSIVSNELSCGSRFLCPHLFN